MCGIAGIHSFQDELNIEKYKVRIDCALNALSKRGPDANGMWIDENKKTLFGHTRLSIIDTSVEANQPFIDETKQHVLVFNGEIFNFKELARDLTLKGIKFKTTSDTEVLLQLLIKYGAKSFEKLNGFFAIAYYNTITTEFLLARDRFGVKPLHYKLDENAISFSSELKGLKCIEPKLILDKEILPIYFHLNYIPSPYSIYENVKKVEPGTFIKIINGETSFIKYYNLNDSFAHPSDLNYQDAQKTLRTTLTDAVNKRLIADVPLGTFLSGGIDSSIVTGLAAQEVKNLNTFSIGFADEPYFDETNYALAVSKLHNTNHHVFKLKNSDFYEQLFNVLDYLDEPFADSSALAVYILCMHTKKQVTVALSGDGADELFAGYNKHSAEFNAQQDSILNKLIKSSNPILKHFPESRNSKILNKFRQVKKYSSILQLPPKERYWRMAGFYANSEINQLLINPKLSERDSVIEKISKVVSGSEINSILQMDQLMLLEGDMLVKVDRMSMANGLEVRSPFMDYRVVNLANSFPADFKINKQRRKKILIDAFSDLLPKEILNRKKQGFEVPLLKWFKTELSSYIFDDLLNQKFIEEQKLFNYNYIQILKKQLYSNSPGDCVAKLWALIVFQHWYKKQNS